MALSVSILGYTNDGAEQWICLQRFWPALKAEGMLQAQLCRQSPAECLEVAWRGCLSHQAVWWLRNEVLERALGWAPFCSQIRP